MHAPLDDAGISLRSTLPQGRAIGGAGSSGDIQVQSLCSDSRRVRPGDLFVALPGLSNDGHDFVTDAIQRGASAVLTERMLPAGVPQYIVDDTRVAYSQLCLELAGRPQQQMRLTGHGGKDRHQPADGQHSTSWRSSRGFDQFGGLLRLGRPRPCSRDDTASARICDLVEADGREPV